MLTHYYQHLKYSTRNCCHLTGLAMVAEVRHPLKISLGHQVHGWKMHHRWSDELPSSFLAQLCKDANNVIFKTWLANSWRQGWRCLLASLPCCLDWTLDWLSVAGKQGLVEQFSKAELQQVADFFPFKQKLCFQWADSTNPLVNINVLSPTEQALVWQRVYGVKA